MVYLSDTLRYSKYFSLLKCGFVCLKVLSVIYVSLVIITFTSDLVNLILAINLDHCTAKFCAGNIRVFNDLSQIFLENTFDFIRLILTMETVCNSIMTFLMTCKAIITALNFVCPSYGIHIHSFHRII
jgi:hypothetical protein